MTNKLFRQHKIKIDHMTIGKYVKAIQNEGLCLQLEIAEELAQRDQTIERQTRMIKHLVTFINGKEL